MVANDDSIFRPVDRYVPTRRFHLPRMGHETGWALHGTAQVFARAGRGRQTPVTAGTVLHAASSMESGKSARLIQRDGNNGAESPFGIAKTLWVVKPFGHPERVDVFTCLRRLCC